MAIKTQTTSDSPEPYTVNRAFYWGGAVVAAGDVVQLTKNDAISLLAANKVTPGAPTAEKPASKKAKAADAGDQKQNEVTT